MKYARVLLILYMVFVLAVSVWADVDTKDGVAVTTGTSFDGCSSASKYDGQTIKASGGSGGFCASPGLFCVDFE